MTTPRDIYTEATRRGLRLEPAGEMLAVIPKGKCPPDFVAVLREHKRELLDWLETRNIQLTHDEMPWLHVARQLLDGEFDGLMDNSVRGGLEIGLRSIAHPLCRRAYVYLQTKKGK
jgi:hypothetical protein